MPDPSRLAVTRRIDSQPSFAGWSYVSNRDEVHAIGRVAVHAEIVDLALIVAT